MSTPSSSSPTDSNATPLWGWRDAPSPEERLTRAASYDSPHGLHSSALQAAETPRLALRVMLGSLLTIVLLVVVLMVTPWQQTVSGSGAVTAFSPDARPQSVEAQISARIQQWNVVEGDAVAAGDTIAVLEDISTSFMDNRFVERIADSRTSELRVLELDTERARQTQSQAQQKLRAARAKLDNVTLEVMTTRDRLQRTETLYADGLTSLRSLESDQLAFQKTRADSVAASADWEAARQEVQSARLDVDRKVSTLDARRAELDLRLDNAQERQSASVVRAPIDGIIARVREAGPGQTVKEGDQLALVVPETDDQAAELFVSSLDAAIVEPGSRVQLQFAGFPALQFAAFPGVSVGIFTGTVRVVDPVDDGAGRYRLLVVPDTAGTNPAWPDQSYLRQGSGVTGWVMLTNVSLGYEIWRRMNGLPPEIPVRT
ncbi:MAG: HlyD family efflux transporter periplasmic adaptor subunit [Bacteroidota bacterium]